MPDRMVAQVHGGTIRDCQRPSIGTDRDDSASAGSSLDCVAGLPFNKTPKHRVSVPMTTSHQNPIWE
jgi:hypothetical protein